MFYVVERDLKLYFIIYYLNVENYYIFINVMVVFFIKLVFGKRLIIFLIFCLIIYKF